MADRPWFGSKWPEGVPKDITGYDKPLFQILDDAAAQYPNATYTIFEGASRTFSQVKDAADRVANFLASRGIKKGDRVAIFLPNIPHYPIAFFGIMKAGAAAVTCNPMYTPDELNFQLKDSGAKAVFCMDHPEFYPGVCKAIQGTDVETVVICNIKSFLPKLKGFLGGLLGKLPKADSHMAGHIMYDDAVKNAQPNPPSVSIDADKDLALVLYTGGTTGVPKGATHPHRDLLSNALALNEWILIEQQPGQGPSKLVKGGAHCYLGVLPWYHSFGMTCALLSSVMSASRLVCIPDPRAGNPPFTNVLKAVQDNKCTAMVAVPTIYSAFVNHPNLKDYDLSSIQACFSGGAPLPLEVIRQFEAATGSIIFEGYGLTETSPVLTTNPSNKDTRKPGSVGLPIPGTDIKILDPEDSKRELAQGEDGEIAASGPQIMAGYWNRPEATDEVMVDLEGKRFFLTGDIGHLDEDGFLVITDRKKDLILVGGFNAYPREIEEVLFEHPKVAQAAVVGVPDEHAGEMVKAFVQLKPGEESTEEEMKAWCKERLAGYKRPRSIEFRDELPVSVVGKVLRRVLKDEELAKLKDK